jgi:magnesium chelatase family protein
MLARVFSLGLRGVDGYPVLVELDLANGLPSFTTVGLPDSAVREARERVASAVRNCGFKFPSRRITVNLAPAQSRKQGTQFDLPIALAVLSASGQLPAPQPKHCFLGELSLDGALRPVAGALAMAIRAKQEGYEAIVVPEENGAEVAATGITTYTAASLSGVVDFLNGGTALNKLAAASAKASRGTDMKDDMADVRGQTFAKRALEIAAAGGHNLLMIGPPGSGKSMLAKRLPTILPPLTEGEALEATRVHSAFGRAGLVTRRPFRAPHHTASATSLIGGGPSCRPGEVALAHAGVLFLDEVSEFGRASLEALRQPLEDQKIVVARAKDVLEYPARFMLVAAANPCPCGLLGVAGKVCRCAPATLKAYHARLSGPLLDRIDLHVELGPVEFSQWAGEASAGESSSAVRSRVVAARARQRKRLKRRDFAVNAAIPARDLRRLCPLDAEGTAVLESVASARGLSARALDRVLRVTRTIADLAGSETILPLHIREAVQFRGLERLSVVC